MSSFDQKRVSRKSSKKDQASSVIVPVVVCLITAAATIGTAVLSHRFEVDGRACADFSSRLDRIDDLPDLGIKAHRLSALVAGNPLRDCESYAVAVRERDELAAGVQERRSESRPDPLVKLQPTANPVLPTSETQEPASPVIVERPSAAPSTTTTRSTEIAVLEPPLVNQVPGQELPPLTVTPHDPNSPFEGGIGDKLTLRRSVQYELRPPQYTTTTYNVSKGTVMVTVDGQPYLTCKPGNTFHLFWKTAPDFSIVTYSNSAALTVIDQESGKHLGSSDCIDPLG